MGFDFILIVPLIPSHCNFSFVFGGGVSFLVSSSVFLSMNVQQLVVIPVISQEGVSARPYMSNFILLHVYNQFIEETSIHFLSFKNLLACFVTVLSPIFFALVDLQLKKIIVKSIFSRFLGESKVNTCVEFTMLNGK